MVSIVKLWLGRICAVLLAALLPVLAAIAVETPTAAAYSRKGLPVEFLDVPSPSMGRNIRVEFQGGVTRISFDQIVERTAISLNTGRLLVNDSTTTSLGHPLTLGTTPPSMSVLALSCSRVAVVAGSALAPQRRSCA